MLATILTVFVIAVLGYLIGSSMKKKTSTDTYSSLGLKSRALVIVDVINAFLPGGELAAPNGDKVIDVINNLMINPVNGDPNNLEYSIIIATNDSHPNETKHFDRWVKHAVSGTKSAEFPEELSTIYIDKVFLKGTGTEDDGYSGATDEVVTFLRDCKINDVDVVGIATDYCVLETVKDFHSRGFNVRVLTNGCAGITEASTEKALTEMRALPGVTVI